MIRAEINELENRKIIDKINETKTGFFENTNKNDKPLTILTKKNRRFNLVNQKFKSRYYH